MRKHRQSRLQFSSLCPWGWVQAGRSVQAGYPLRTSASPSQKESRWEREGPVCKASSLLSFGEWWTLSTRCPFFSCSSQCIWAVLPGPALSSGVPHGASELRYLVPSSGVLHSASEPCYWSSYFYALYANADISPRFCIFFPVDINWTEHYFLFHGTSYLYCPKQLIIS